MLLVVDVLLALAFRCRCRRGHRQYVTLASLLDKQLMAERKEAEAARNGQLSHKTSSRRRGMLAKLPPPSPASVVQKATTLGVTAPTHRSKTLDLSFQVRRQS